MPYINIEMDLHDQLKYLSAAAHVIAILFTFSEVHGTFIPSQLYQDLQVMVKNIFFCVAKMKRDNPDGKFFIYQLGTDWLEWIFGWIHSENGSDVPRTARKFAIYGRYALVVPQRPTLSYQVLVPVS